MSRYVQREQLLTVTPTIANNCYSRALCSVFSFHSPDTVVARPCAVTSSMTMRNRMVVVRRQTTSSNPPLILILMRTIVYWILLLLRSPLQSPQIVVLLPLVRGRPQMLPPQSTVHTLRLPPPPPPPLSSSSNVASQAL